MAGHGGARPGSGPKHKWYLFGKHVKTYPVRVPEVITEGVLNEFIGVKLSEVEADKSCLSESE